MSINDEWVRYLRAEGYLGSISDMLRTALQAEAASSYKNLNDLWVAYLNAEGYTGQINDMMYEWLGDKGYTGNLNDRLLAALKADDIFAADAIACVITLTTAYAASFGLQPATISGQTFSITGGTNGVGYLASTDVAIPTPAWTGRRLVELGSYSNNGAANIRGGIVLPDGSKGIFMSFNSAGQVQFRLESPVGTLADPAVDVDELSSDHYAVAVDMPSGDVYIYIDGVGTGGIGPYAGFFSGATGFSLLGLIESATSGDATMTFVTDSSLFTGTYTGSELDWCGNAVSNSCNLIFTTDIAPSFGAQPATINGNVLSMVQQDPAVQFAASTDYITQTPPPSSNTNIVEVTLTADTGVISQAVIGDVFSGNYIIITRNNEGQYTMQEFVGSVSGATLYDSPTLAIFAFGYGSDGTLYAYVNGAQVSTAAMNAIQPTGTYLTGVFFNGAPATTGSIEFIPDAASMSGTYVDSSLRDWCGNVL